MENSYLQTHYSNIYKDFKQERQGQYASFFTLNFDEAVEPFDEEVTRCLDLGCGFGNFVYYLQQKGFKKVVGIDLDEEQIHICQKDFPGYQFFSEDIFNFLSRQERKYDLIGIFSVLEHIPKAKTIEFLSLIKSKLSDQGLIILSTPNMETIFGNTGGRYGDFTHTTGFTYFSLLQVLKMSGFRDEEYSIEIFGSPKKKKGGVLFFIYNILSKITLFLTKCYFVLLRYQMPKISSYTLCCVIKRK